jgi:membrane protease YdiL (CAAX protease family)
VVALVLGNLFHQPVSDQLVWHQRDFWLGTLAALPMLALVLVLLRLNWQPALNLRHLLETRLLPWLAGWSWWQLGLLSILAGVGEECFFRGFVQGKLVEAGGVVLGVLAASVLFGLVHLVTNTYGIMAALVGIYLGWLLIWSQNLLLPITTHAVYDFVLLVWLIWKKPNENGD